MALRPILDPDFGWHLRTGQLILSSGRIPSADPYSFTRPGAPWVEHEWLWQLGAAVLDRLGGNVAVVLANGLAVAATLALVYLALRDRGVGQAFAAAGTGVALANVAVYSEARPGQVVGLFTAALLFAFEHYRRTADWRWLALAPATELAWANCHGSYAVGLAACGIYLLAAVWERRPWQPWLAVTGACLAATVVNPRSIGIYRFTLAASRLTVNRQLVHEWQSPNFADLGFSPVLAALVLLLALPVVLRVSPRGRAQQLLLAGGAAAAMVSQQFILFFAVASAPLVGELLERAWPGRGLSELSRGSAAALGAALLALAVAIPGQHLTPAAYGAAVAREYPADAVAFIQRQQLPGPLWNELDWGGYLIGALPQAPVFSDGRTEMYGQAFISHVASETFGLTPIKPELDQYGIRLVLVKAQSPVATELRALAGWHEAYTDRLAAVFTREAA